LEEYSNVAFVEVVLEPSAGPLVMDVSGGVVSAGGGRLSLDIARLW
jgi:hypothetical protein